MYARVWRFGILPGKAEEFAAILKSAIPAWKQMAGFRSIVALRTGPGEMLDGTVVSTWESMDALRDSESTTFQQTLIRLLPCCEPHPVMREEEVILSEFASPDSSDMTVIS